MREQDAAVAEARAGDGEAFRRLVDRHGRTLFRLAYRMTGNEQDAEDVVQETFLRAYRQLGRFESRANFGTWLHRIAVNCSIDLIRSRGRRETVREIDELCAAAADGDGRPAAPDRLAQSAQIQRRVQETLDDLTPMERAAFVLRHFEGLSTGEIGRTLGLGASASKHSVFRAVRKMRLALEPFVDAWERTRCTSVKRI